MINLSDREINNKIAEMLGFERTGNHWSYPEKYKHLIASVPNPCIPDFIKLIDFSLDIREKIKYGFSQFVDSSDLTK